LVNQRISLREERPFQVSWLLLRTHLRCFREIQIFQQILSEMRSLRQCSELKDKRGDRAWLRDQDKEVHQGKEDQEGHHQDRDKHQDKELQDKELQDRGHHQVIEQAHLLEVKVKVHLQVTQLIVAHLKAALHHREDHLHLTVPHKTICLETPIL
jgi:hypothetical protein